MLPDLGLSPELRPSGSGGRIPLLRHETGNKGPSEPTLSQQHHDVNSSFGRRHAYHRESDQHSRTCTSWWARYIQSTMATRTVSTLKFVGSISLGLLTGFSYTLCTLTVPTLLTLPSASTASKAFHNLSSVSLVHLRTLASISGSSFFLAYLLSPRSQKHPYLLWTTLFVGVSGLTDIILPHIIPPKTATKQIRQKHQDKKGNSKQRQMDMSYEVLGGVASDRDSEGTVSGEEMDEDVNGEEVRVQMEGFMESQIIRTAVSAIAFTMSVVGIWGDGAADLVIIEM